MSTTDSIPVQVCYALPDRQDLVSLSLPQGCTARQAIEASGLLQKHPDIDVDGDNKIGVFGKLVTLTTPLRAHDRVEIYRPLVADPKEVRRRRAAEGKTLKKGAPDLPKAG
ncbi:MAG: RnfH family protein [Rhodocyclaceae bacterium]